MSRLLIITLLLTLAASVHAVEVIQPYSAKYSVHYNGFKVGEMTQKVAPLKDGSYMMETVVYTTGVTAWFVQDRVTEKSIWRYHENRIRPISYKYHYTGRGKERQETLDFDWEAMKIHSRYKGEKKDLPLSLGVYDKQLFQLALRHELGNGVEKFHYQVASRGKLRDYLFQQDGEEGVVTPMGTMASVKVKRKDADFWLAKEHGYLVVKLEKVDEDDNHVVSYISEMSL